MVVEELTYIAIDYGTTVASRRLRKRSARGGEGRETIARGWFNFG